MSTTSLNKLGEEICRAAGVDPSQVCELELRINRSERGGMYGVLEFRVRKLDNEKLRDVFRYMVFDGLREIPS